MEINVKSALGKNLEEAINKQMKDCVDGYNSPVKRLVEHHVTECIKTALEQNYKGKIIEMIAAKLTGEHVDSIVSASVSKALELLRERDRY